MRLGHLLLLRTRTVLRLAALRGLPAQLHMLIDEHLHLMY